MVSNATVESSNNSSAVSNATDTPLNSSLPTANATATTNSTVPVNSTDAVQGPAQTFCVTILALPAERKLTDGEKLFTHSKQIFSSFFAKALGVD